MGATPTRYMGGQAVMDGVMMRGEQVWAVAVRREDGGIEVRVFQDDVWIAPTQLEDRLLEGPPGGPKPGASGTPATHISPREPTP